MLEIISLRQQKNQETDPVLVEDPESEEDEKEEKLIVCSQCHHIITSPSDRIDVQGSHRHTFANPQGLIFEIGCFHSAAGCFYTGEPSSEWSWFPGFQWRVAICSKCLLQMGWLFVSAGETRFNGLILERLIFPE